MIFKKRANVDKVLSTILQVCQLNISKLFRVDPTTQSSEVSHKRLIQLFSVLADFCFDSFLCITQLPFENEAVSKTTEGLVNFIMNIWINLDIIKYYERQDQMSKMIHLLQALQEIIPLCNTRHTSTLPQPCLPSILTQSICTSHQSLYSCSSKSVEIKEGYDYRRDVLFVLSAWVNQLYAHNYTYACPKNSSLKELNKSSLMVLYNPEAAFKIYSEYPIKGDKGYSKTIQTFREN